jgi:hypothetical protein
MSITRVYIPADVAEHHIEKYNISDVMDQIHGTPDVSKTLDGKFFNNVSVNVGSNRYHVFKRDNLTCACCGIKANLCWLDKDEQNSTPKNTAYHFNFYAECGNRDKVYEILFEKNHIISRSTGGADNIGNCQTMCFNCAKFKGTTNLSNDELRCMMFCGYRAFKSAKTLNLAKFKLGKFRGYISKDLNAIDELNKALDLVAEEKKPQLIDRIEFHRVQAERWQKLCDDYELNCQITGLLPEFNPKE